MTGSPDLDDLWAELAHWPGWNVESIHPSACYSSHAPDGVSKPGQSWLAHYRDSWCIRVRPDGWREDYVVRLAWGKSIAIAAATLAAEMAMDRTYPHGVHIKDGTFVRGCLDCADEMVDHGVEDYTAEMDEDEIRHRADPGQMEAFA